VIGVIEPGAAAAAQASRNARIAVLATKARCAAALISRRSHACGPKRV